MVPSPRCSFFQPRPRCVPQVSACLALPSSPANAPRFLHSSRSCLPLRTYTPTIFHLIPHLPRTTTNLRHPGLAHTAFGWISPAAHDHGHFLLLYLCPLFSSHLHFHLITSPSTSSTHLPPPSIRTIRSRPPPSTSDHPQLNSSHPSVRLSALRPEAERWGRCIHISTLQASALSTLQRSARKVRSADCRLQIAECRLRIAK